MPNPARLMAGSAGNIIDLIKLNPISKLPTCILVEIANRISAELNVALMLDQHIEQRGLTIEEIEFYQSEENETN